MSEEKKMTPAGTADTSVVRTTPITRDGSTQKAVSPISLYERMGERTTQPFAMHILDVLQPISNLDLIDIAAGTGGLALVATERGARVLATDVSSAMIERTRERLGSGQHARAEIMDFSMLNLSDAGYDIAVSNFGVLAFSNWRLGLAEMIRVTRHGGRISLSMWTHWDDCSPAHLMKRVFSTLFADRALWPANMFPVFTEESLHADVRDAGCTDVHVEVVTADWSPFSSVDVVSECDPMFKGFPGYAALTSLEAEKLHAALQEAFQAYAREDGVIRLPTKAFVVTARRL
jgi:ubiquinone/menaquinone biosynthesis C-methylase UbiE